MSYGSLFSCGNGKRGCFADVVNMELHVCPSVPSPLQRSAADHGIWFSGEPGCSLRILPTILCRPPRPPHTVSFHWHKMEPWAQRWCCPCPSPARHVGFSGTPHQLPWTQNSTRSCFVFSCLFRFLNVNSKLAQTLLSLINKYSPVWDCFSFNYIIP